MTLDQAMFQAMRAVDTMWDVSRADAEALLCEHGASDAEIAAVHSQRDAQWSADRAALLLEMRRELIEHFGG